jgi:PAS domain S-box-containing protein
MKPARQLPAFNREDDRDVFCSIFDRVAVGLAQMELASGHCRRVNQRFAEVFGRSPDELEHLEFQSLLAPDSRLAYRTGLDRLAAGQVRDFSVAAHCLRGDGANIVVKLSASALWGPGEAPVCFILAAEDATELNRIETALQASEDRFRTLVEQAPDGFELLDQQGRFVDLNLATCKQLGYSRPELLNLGIPDIDPIFNLGRFEALFESLQGKSSTFETIHRRKDGSTFPVEVTSSVVMLGGERRMVSLVRDITERKRAEEERERLQNHLFQAQKMESVGRLAGGIAHDLNNVISAILGNLYLLQEEVCGRPSARESAGEILKAATRAKELVQQILTFSRRRDQQKQILRLDGIIHEVAKLLRASLPANISIDLAIDPQTPPVLADPTQMHQVLMNLGTNAWQSMEAHGGHLTIKLDRLVPGAALARQYPELKPQEYSHLTVADTGQGMDARTMEHIFEPFFTTKSAGKGTGLGLSVVHGIVRACEGVITTASEEGRGTTFEIYLPSQPAATGSVSVAPVPAVDGQGRRILVVDDEEAIVRVLLLTLKRFNYLPTGCHDGPDALLRFQTDPGQFDLVVTDLNMPTMNGLEVATRMHEQRPDLPVILCSGFAAELTEEKLASAGISRILNKPVSPGELAEAIQQILGT